MKKAAYKVMGGKMIRVSLGESNGKIREIKITGDFFLHPEELINELEDMLVGKPLNVQDLTSSIKMLMENRDATLLGASTKDFVKCILIAGGRDG